MKHLLSLCMGLCMSFYLWAQPASDLKLWYDKPAELWVEALPLGNGRLGAMVYGDPVNEAFQLNEETIWGGSPHNNTNPKAREHLAGIRRLIFEGRNREAQELCGRAISSTGANGMPYQTIGSLHLDFEGIQDYTDYYRELDIDRAVSTTRFRAEGVEYVREAFTSFTDDLLIVRLTASEEGKISFRARYSTPYADAVASIPGRKELQLDGKANDHEGIEGKVRFTTLTRIDHQGGILETLPDQTVKVTGANSVILYVSAGTNFINYRDVSGNSLEKARHYLKNAGKNYTAALNAHTEFYQRYFRRVSLDVGTTQAGVTTHPQCTPDGRAYPYLLQLARFPGHLFDDKPAPAAQSFHATVGPYLRQRGKQVYRSGMALYQHLSDPCRTAEVAIDLEGRMRVEQVGVGAAVLSFLLFGRAYLFSDQFIGMVPVQQACPQTYLPSHRPSRRVVAPGEERGTCRVEEYRRGPVADLPARIEPPQVRDVAVTVVGMVPVVHPFLKLPQPPTCIGASCPATYRRLSVNTVVSPTVSAACMVFRKRSCTIWLSIVAPATTTKSRFPLTVGLFSGE